MIVLWIAEGIVALVLFGWAYQIARKPNAPRWMRTVAPWLIILWAISVLLGVTVLQKGFKTVAESDPTMKAAALAETISRSMQYTVAGMLILVAFLVFLVVVSVKMKKAKQDRVNE